MSPAVFPCSPDIGSKARHTVSRKPSFFPQSGDMRKQRRTVSTRCMACVCAVLSDSVPLLSGNFLLEIPFQTETRKPGTGQQKPVSCGPEWCRFRGWRGFPQEQESNLQSRIPVRCSTMSVTDCLPLSEPVGERPERIIR